MTKARSSFAGGGVVFLVLVIGTVLSVVIGVATGTIAPQDIFTVIAKGPDGESGVMSMYDITVISIVVAGVIGLVKANGGIDFVLNAIKRHVHSPKGAQIGIAALSSLVDISTANNTIAIVMASYLTYRKRFAPNGYYLDKGLRG